MNASTSPPPNTLLDLASTTTILERLLAWGESRRFDALRHAEPELLELLADTREVMAREHVEPAEPIDLRMVPGPCHREILGKLEGIAEAVDGLSLIGAQAFAQGSPIVNAILDAGHGSPSRSGEAFADVYTAEDVERARAASRPLDVRKAAELRDVCLARGIDPMRATVRLDRTDEGRVILVVEGEQALEDDGGSF